MWVKIIVIMTIYTDRWEKSFRFYLFVCSKADAQINLLGSYVSTKCEKKFVTHVLANWLFPTTPFAQSDFSFIVQIPSNVPKKSALSPQEICTPRSYQYEEMKTGKINRRSQKNEWVGNKMSTIKRIIQMLLCLISPWAFQPSQVGNINLSTHPFASCSGNWGYSNLTSNLHSASLD